MAEDNFLNNHNLNEMSLENKNQLIPKSFETRPLESLKGEIKAKHIDRSLDQI